MLKAMSALNLLENIRHSYIFTATAMLACFRSSGMSILFVLYKT